MIYEKPNTEEKVDLYMCKNPDFRRRIRVTAEGEPAPIHCGVVATKFNTINKIEWERISLRNKNAIRAIKARIEARKVMELV